MEMYRRVTVCPWCGGAKKRLEYKYTGYDGNAVRCSDCGLVYSDYVLNEEGLRSFWKNYESEVHCVNEEKVSKRRLMYKQDFNFIKPLAIHKNNVLDIGCGNGEFLDYFYSAGFECEGTEFGDEARRIAGQRYNIYFGELSELHINKKFDLITFRGVVQYLLHPKESLEKAVSLLNDGGLIFISAVNNESICFSLFKERFTLPVMPSDYYMYNEEILNKFMDAHGMCLLAKDMPYLGTPYENYKEDIKKVSKALEIKDRGGEANFSSPPFFDNMLRLVYRKLP